VGRKLEQYLILLVRVLYLAVAAVGGSHALVADLWALVAAMEELEVLGRKATLLGLIQKVQVVVALVGIMVLVVMVVV
jgi:hypothetical protein